jgi:hypothetical protein
VLRHGLCSNLEETEPHSDFGFKILMMPNDGRLGKNMYLTAHTNILLGVQPLQ